MILEEAMEIYQEWPCAHLSLVQSCNECPIGTSWGLVIADPDTGAQIKTTACRLLKATENALAETTRT